MHTGYIAHIDMDAFFAAVEERDDSALRGKPIVVGADPKKGKGRGVVSTASYKARTYGIHSAMPISIAYKKCPHAIFLPVNMPKYIENSKKIFNILYAFTPDIEKISIDEAFFDLTGTEELFGDPLTTCKKIKNTIKKETKLTASIGIAPIKMAAKIASDIKKPDGLVFIKQEELTDFMWPLPISKIWGVGKKSEKVLQNLQIKTIGQLAQYDKRRLEIQFGKQGIKLWQLANGIDDRKVERAHETKSISNEITFDKDTRDMDRIRGAFMDLSCKVSRRMRSSHLVGKTISVKIRLAPFRTYQRSHTFKTPTNDPDQINSCANQLFESFQHNQGKIRLVGVKLSNLSDADQSYKLPLTDKGSRNDNLTKVIDQIKDRYGEKAIGRGRSLKY